MKRVKESGASFRKKKKAREEELKKNIGAILKFLNISLQSSLSSANERDKVSSFSKSLPHTETEKTVELEQNNQEVIIESIPTDETLIAKDKIDDINNVAIWPEVITHNVRVEMVKAEPERYQNKEGLFKPAIRVIKEGGKEKESLSFLSKKWFDKTLKKVIKFLDHGCFIRIAIQDYIVSVASCFNQEMIILNSFPNPLLISGI